MDKWLANNTAAKIIALAVALILWAMVHVDTDAPTITRSSQGDQTTITNLSIKPYGFDDQKYVLKSVSPQQVSISVAGQRSLLTSLPSASEYEVKMDLSSINEPGKYEVPLQFDPPAGVELLSIQPSKVTVTVEEKVTQEFQAVVLTTGVPADGFTELDPIFEDGNTVKVTLPESEMKQVQKIQGELSVDGANGNVSGRIKLVAYSNNGEVLDDAVIEPSSLKVQIPLSSNVSSKTLPLTVSYEGKLPEGLVLSGVQAGVKEVKLYGASGMLKDVDSFPPVKLDLSQIKAEGTTRYNETLTAPEGVQRVEPSSVQYTVTVVPYKEKVIANVPITLTGQTNGLKAQVTDPESGKMDVTVVGAPNLLSDVTAADVALTADLTGLGVGTHNIQLKVSLPDYIGTAGTSPPSVTVEVTSADSSAGDPAAPPTTETQPQTQPETQKPESGTSETETGTEPPTDNGSTNGSTDVPKEPEVPTEGSGESEPTQPTQPGTEEENPPVENPNPTIPDSTQPGGEGNTHTEPPAADTGGSSGGATTTP
ncbi:hypothetical protein B9G55_23655 [Saccharibacillus sp. O16]|nr:hypothetical protein B9G55_23655 [Saccharibacillus sp. O16]